MNKIFIITNGKESFAVEDDDAVKDFFDILEQQDDVDRHLYYMYEVKLYKDDAMQAYADLRNEQIL